MILLDTCVIVWVALNSNKLSKNAANAVLGAQQTNSISVSDISLWETAMLIKKGRVVIENTPSKFIDFFLQSRNITVRSISPEIAEMTVNLSEEISGDPADRIIAATAIIHRAQLITSDKKLRDCKLIDTIW